MTISARPHHRKLRKSSLPFNLRRMHRALERARKIVDERESVFFIGADVQGVDFKAELCKSVQEKADRQSLWQWANKRFLL